MELIERYVHQVGRRLPERLRGDVEAELGSLLQDALEAHTGRKVDAGSDWTEEEQIAVLKEFGPPAQVAAQYAPQLSYLIGPKVLHAYWIVVAAVTGAALIASIVTTVLAMVGTTLAGATLLEQLGRGWSLFFSTAASGIGVATIVFAVLERTLPEGAFDDKKGQEWDPRTLPAIQDQERIKPVGLMVEIGFCVLLLVVLNAFPGRIGGGIYYTDGAWHTFPTVLSAAFFTLYLPLMNIEWILKIGFNVTLLWQGRWQVITRIADLLLDFYSIYILTRLVNGPSVLNTDAFSEIMSAVPQVQNTVVPMLSNMLRVAFLIALIVSWVKVVFKIIWVFRLRSTVLRNRVGEGKG